MEEKLYEELHQGIKERIGEMTETEKDEYVKRYFIERYCVLIDELGDINTDVIEGRNWSDVGYQNVKEELKKEKVFHKKVFEKFYEEAIGRELDFKEINDMFNYLRAQKLNVGDRK